MIAALTLAGYVRYHIEPIFEPSERLNFGARPLKHSAGSDPLGATLAIQLATTGDCFGLAKLPMYPLPMDGRVGIGLGQ